MFKEFNKKDLVALLQNEASCQVASSDRKIRLKGRINASLVDMVENAPLENFKHMSFNKNGGLNKGYIIEDLVLDYKSKAEEDTYTEVKYFGNDTPNPLINEDTKLVYIVINKASLKGAFIIRDMKVIRNERLTYTFLMEHKDLLHPCEKLNNYLGI